MRLKPMTESNFDLADAMETMNTSQVEELTRQLEEATTKAPNDVRSLLMLGNGYYLRGKIAQAVETFKIAVKINPNIPYAYYYLGVCLYRSARIDEAIAVLKKVTELSPGMVMANYWLGIAYYHKGAYKESRNAFELLLENNAESIIAHYHAALACMADQALPCACHHLESLLRLGNQDPQVYLYLGNIYFRTNRVPDAITTYRKGLENNAGNIPLQRALSYLTEVQEP
jgi:cytochrome c-type biogenesis protein CcmH/NrfG